MIDAFQQATAGILAVLGEDAILRGEVVSPVRRVNVARNVEMYDREGNLMYAEHVATINKQDAPAKGDTLVVAGEDFILDSLIEDNGYSARWMLRKV